MSAALLVASTRTNGIPMHAFDLASQLRAPHGLGPIQGRRPTPRFEHEDFMGRSNGSKKTQAWSRCEQSGHNANTCTIELVDRARGWGKSSFIPCLSCAMSFYSVSFMNEGIEECVEGILASGHQRAG